MCYSRAIIKVSHSDPGGDWTLKHYMFIPGVNQDSRLVKLKIEIRDI